MKEYEIVAKYYNACGGMAHAQTSFDEAELNDPDDYIRTKHPREFRDFAKEVSPGGQIRYLFDNGHVMYSYEFTEL